MSFQPISASETYLRGPFCGCAGCTQEAHAIVLHPQHGKRAVCEGCDQGFEVVRYV